MVIIFAVQPVDSVRSFGPGVHYCARGTKLSPGRIWFMCFLLFEEK